MSTKKQTQVTKQDWLDRQQDYREGVTASIDAIRNGSIDEVELNRLSNFCQTALALIGTVRQIDWERAAQVAELRGLIHADDPKFKVFY